MKMSEVYLKLIKAGRKTIDEVPESLKQNVQLLLDSEVQENEKVIE